MTERFLGSIISPSPVEPTGSFADQTASGVWNIHDPLLFGQASDWPVTGNIDPGKFIESIFACAAYTGTGSSLTVNTGVLNSTESTGVDLSNKGGLIWIKNRDANDDHVLTDTERGVGKVLSSNSTAVESTDADTVTSFNSTGFTVGADVKVNTSGEDYIAWIFRKQPKFFDVVTWTGDGSGTRDIAHNLGTTIGFMVMKQTESTLYEWFVYHRGYTSNTGKLDSTSAFNTAQLILRPTPGQETTHFQVSGTYNGSGESHVAYLWAHNDDDGGFGENGDQDIIKCGSYTGNGSTGNNVTLGFEPQWVLVKRADASEDWTIYDARRGGMVTTDIDATYLEPNDSAEESSHPNRMVVTPNGFMLNINDGRTNASGGTYIYVAIRRGPMRTPATGLEVFDVTETGTDNSLFTTDLHTIDVNFQHQKDGTNYWFAQHRITGERGNLRPNRTDALNTSWGTDTGSFDQFTATSDPQKQKVRAYTSNSNAIFSFKRAPKFFDNLAYTGGSSYPTNVTHNLGVTPELILVKGMSDSVDGIVYNSTLGKTKQGYWAASSAFETRDTADQNDGYWGDHTSSIIQVGNNERAGKNGDNYMAYLFATLAGVSKVGTYSGTGSDINVDCGFSNGSFFVVVKRTDSSGNWYVWDSQRGIVAGNDPYLQFNSTAAEITNTDYIDPLSSGFTITSSAPSDLNASGGTYVFLAIAK